MDEETFTVIWGILIGLATGIVTGVTVAGTLLGLPALILSYAMLIILYGMLALGAYWQWKEGREERGRN